MKTTELVRKIESGELNAVFEKLYGAKDAEMQKARYIRTIHNFEADYGTEVREDIMDQITSEMVIDWLIENGTVDYID